MIKIGNMKIENENGQVLEAIQGLSTRIDGLSSRMDTFAIGQEELRSGQEELRSGQDELRSGQEEMRGSIKSLEKGQDELRSGQEEMRGSIKSLEKGQEELRSGQEEIHEMIQEFSTQVDRRFESLEGRVGNIEDRVVQIGSSMVTKDYLDNKLAEHGARYGEIDRKTNIKIGLLTDVLVSEKALTPKSAEKVLSTEPFARIK
jgi:chromosome segregation ATPase